MNRTVSEELRIRETGNHPEDSLLLRDSQSRLETDEIPHAAVPVLAMLRVLFDFFAADGGLPGDGLTLVDGGWAAQ